MPNHLIVDGTDLATFGAYITGTGTYNAPEKQYEWSTVPNRDGAILGVERRLQNVEVEYPCIIYQNLDENITALRNFLLSRDGLVQIEDTAHDDEFRMGVYSGPFDPIVSRRGDRGKFVLEFLCQPQRWLKSGAEIVTYDVTSSARRLTLKNPTQFPAKPLILLDGYGTIQVGSTTSTKGYRYIEISDSITSTAVTRVGIDCETMAIYEASGVGARNMNPYVGIRTGSSSGYGADPPLFLPGWNEVKVYGSTVNYTKFQVTPRWWRV